MSDYVIKALAHAGKVRAYAIDSTELVRILQDKHDTWPTASAALGRAATVGAMMGAMLKDKEKLTIQINGDGPLGQILIDANSHGIVRGYVKNPHVDLPKNEKGKLDVAKAVGQGNIYVIKDLGLKEPYRGSIPIISGEIAEDFTHYFTISEQIPSAVSLGVLVNPDYSIKAAGGFIIQVLPGLTDDELNHLEEVIAKVPPISKLIAEGKTAEQIIAILFAEYKILEKQKVEFQCNCSVERIESVLFNLGKEEIEDMIEKEETTEIVCQFCRTKYNFSKNDLRNILKKF